MAEVQRTTLMARLSRSEVEAAQDLTRQQEAVRTELEQLEKQLRQLTAEREKIAAERDKAAGERDRLRTRIGELEEKLSQRQTRQQQRPVASVQPDPAILRVALADAGAAGGPHAFRCAHRDRHGRDASPGRDAGSAAGRGCGTRSSSGKCNAGPGHRGSAGSAIIQYRICYGPGTPVKPPGAVSPGPVRPGAVRPGTTNYGGGRPTGPFAAPPAVYAPAVAAPQAERPAAPVAVPAVAHGSLAQVERVLASAGVKVKNLFCATWRSDRGVGGPYIPNPQGHAAGDTVHRRGSLR